MEHPPSKILDGRAPDYLSKKLLSLKYCKSYDTRSRMPYRLPIPRTNSRKRMVFFNALQLWKNISDNDFVYSTDLKAFRRNYVDCIMPKFTPDSFKTDRIFIFLLMWSWVLCDLYFYNTFVFCYFSILNVCNLFHRAIRETIVLTVIGDSCWRNCLHFCSFAYDLAHRRKLVRYILTPGSYLIHG